MRREDRSREALTTIAFPSPKPSPPPLPKPVQPAPRPDVGKARPADTSGAQGAPATPSATLAAAIPVRQPDSAPISAPANGDSARTAGASSGTGSGAGGQGSGPGGGGSGGDGDDDGGSPPDWIGGRIRDSDYPRTARMDRREGRVETEISIDARGRPSGCAVVGSSGSRDLDQATCNLIMRRFRFSPARDRTGRAVTGIVSYDQEWRLREGGIE